MAVYSPGGLNLADTTAPLILGYNNSGSTDAVFAVSSSGDLTITPDGGDVSIAGNLNILAEADLRLQDASGGQYAGFDAPATVSTSYVLTLPAAVGGSGQALRASDGAGALEWYTPGDVGDITSVVAGTGLSGGGTTGAVTLNVDAAQTQITSVGTLTSLAVGAITSTGAFVTSSTGPHAIGGAAQGFARMTFLGSFTSDGSSDEAYAFTTQGALTTVAGDVNIAGTRHQVNVTTQNSSQTVNYIDQLLLKAPTITKGSDTVTNASTLHIQDAPSEATNNYALWVDAGATRLDGTLAVTGVVGIGLARTDGILHVHAATAGSVTANTAADDLVVESDGHTGISILSPDASSSILRFGSPSDNVGAEVTWNHNASLMTIATSKAGATMVLRGGNEATALTLDGSSSTFTGVVGMGGAAQSNYALFAKNSVASQPVLFLEQAHASTPRGIAIDFSADDPNDRTQFFLKNEDSAGVKSYLWSDGGATFTGTVDMGTTGSGGGNQAALLGSDAGYVVLGWEAASNSALADIRAHYNGGSSSFLEFRVDSTIYMTLSKVTSAVEVASKLAVTGNVGIGTSAGDDVLEVSGAGRSMGGGTNYNLAKFVSTTSNKGGILIGGTSYGANDSGVIFPASSTGSLNLNVGSGGDTVGVSIRSGGNVGIGTVSPGNYYADYDNLVVAGAAHTGITIVAGTTSSKSSIAFADGTSGQAAYEGEIIYDHNTNLLKLGTAGDVRMAIDASGNVGIGVTPSHKLDIGGMADPVVRIKSDSGGDPTMIFDAAATSRSARIKFYDNGSTTGGFIDYLHTGDLMNFGAGSASNVTFVVGDMAITSAGTSTLTGNVGIGGSAGSAALEVTGTSSFTGNVDITTAPGAGTHNLLHLNTTSTGDTAPAILMECNRGTEEQQARIRIGATDLPGQSLIFDTDNTSRSLTTALTLDESQNASFTGNIGVGTTANVNYALYVNPTWTTTGNGALLRFDGATTLAVDAQFWGVNIQPKVTEAASGTHPSMASLYVETPFVTNGGATTTAAYALDVISTPVTGATTTYPVRITGNTMDASIWFRIVSGLDWSIGADDSDGDKFKISRNSYLGYRDAITIDSSENTEFIGNVGIGGAPQSNYALFVKHQVASQPVLFLEHDISSPTQPIGMKIDFSNAAPQNESQWFIWCEDSSAQRFTVWSDGDVVNVNGNYGTISDESLKSNMVPARDQRDDVKLLADLAINYNMTAALEDGFDRRLLGWGGQTVRDNGMAGLVMECGGAEIRGEDGEVVGHEDEFLSIRSSIIHTKTTIALGQHLTEWDDYRGRIEALEAALAAM